MKAFHHFVKTKSNFLKLAPYFNEFTSSNKYQSLVETLSGDIDIIMSQMTCYKEDIQYSSADIQKEF